MVTSMRGLYLSVNLPVAMQKAPRKVHIEKAADKAPRSHPNSLESVEEDAEGTASVPNATRITKRAGDYYPAIIDFHAPMPAPVINI
jgi:hypothetical protein